MPHSLADLMNQLLNKSRASHSNIGTLCRELEQLQKEFGNIMQQKHLSETKCEVLKNSISNLERLLYLFQEDSKEWQQFKSQCESHEDHVIGDCLLISSFVAYVTSLSSLYNFFFPLVFVLIEKHHIFTAMRGG